MQTTRRAPSSSSSSPSSSTPDPLPPPLLRPAGRKSGAPKFCARRRPLLRAALAMSRPVSLVKRRQGGLGLVLGPAPASNAYGGSPRCSPMSSPARARRSSLATCGVGDAPGVRAVVHSVVPGGEADRTGLIRPGDVVLRVNGTCLTGYEHANCLLGQVPDDAAVTLELACNGDAFGSAFSAHG